MIVLVNILILALIVVTYWFFFVKKEKAAVKVNEVIRIVVDGGYHPEIIEIPKGQSITLEFERRDPTSCLEEVVIPDFKVRTFLPLNKVTPITIKPEKVGEYSFHCGMSMYFGKIKVV